jgi:DNA-binding NarL/FixJ family response regulator
MTARIVIADDHAAVGAACQRLLESEFSVVAVVLGGEAALEAVADLAPDLLVLDIQMPDLSGIEVLQRLLPQSQRPRVVVLTQHTDAGLGDRVCDLGALGFVTKARMARDLRPAIQAALVGESFRSPLPS